MSPWRVNPALVLFIFRSLSRRLAQPDAKAVSQPMESTRTSLSGVTVAVCFLLTLFFAPCAKSVPICATAPALVFESHA